MESEAGPDIPPCGLSSTLIHFQIQVREPEPLLSLANPSVDPSDIAALEENPIALADVQVDATAEAARPELKRQAQEWANLKQDPNADLFVFVGRWSRQKGVDLIADVMPSMYDHCCLPMIFLII